MHLLVLLAFIVFMLALGLALIQKAWVLALLAGGLALWALFEAGISALK